MKTTKSPSNFGKSEIQVSCPCWRPRRRVLCTCCGLITQGRIRISCGTHTNMWFINDYEECPRCNVPESMLREF